MKHNTWVRDTLIRPEDYQKLCPAKKNELDELLKEFSTIPYIDARTELGPDQTARMSARQKEKMLANAARVFTIESKIKQLLLPEDVVLKRQVFDKKRNAKSAISVSENYIRHISSMTTSFKRNGKFKKGYQNGFDCNQSIITKNYKLLSNLNTKLLVLHQRISPSSQ